MAVWLVRAGRSGEDEDFALKQGVAVIGWGSPGDFSKCSSREDVERLLREHYPEKGAAAIRNWGAQIWAFIARIQVGDLVVLPLKRRSAIAIGEATGPYKYQADAPESIRQTRPVKWLRDDMPRSDFEQDLLDSLGAFMTVCQIQRNNAEARIRALLAGQHIASPTAQEELTDEVAEVEARIDLERSALDQIRKHITSEFREHKLAGLVDGLLKAQGYKTLLSPPGPDGGVDILAGKGSMGFDTPRLCVQVKSQGEPLDVRAQRELQGVMTTHGADSGILVSWGGFRRTVYEENRRMYFRIRLWDADDLIEAIGENYERLPDDLQALLPLKRIWAIVLQD